MPGDVTIPQDVQRTAWEALIDVEAYGVTPRRKIDEHAIEMGQILSQDGELDAREVDRMLRYFSTDRHSSNHHKEAERTSSEGIIWRLWGGDAGEKWVLELDKYMYLDGKEWKIKENKS